MFFLRLLAQKQHGEGGVRVRGGKEALAGCTAAATALAGAADASSCLQTNFAALLDLNLGWVELWWEE